MADPIDDGAGTGATRTGARKYPVGLVAGALGLAFVVLAAGSLFAGMAVASQKDDKVVAAPSSSPPTVAPELPRPVPATLAAPSRLRTCSLAPLAADTRLRDFYGSVINAATGEVLWDRQGSVPVRTGSTLKVVTAAAALSVLGAGFQISTTVVDNGGGAVALVGHGDPTISATPRGTESFYRGAPKLADLAAQTISTFASRHPGEQITSVALDSTYWPTTDNWGPTWDRGEQTMGWSSEVTALQVDGDRANPGASQSPRSTDPIGRAGAAFVAALHAADPGGVVSGGVSVAQGPASGSDTIAEVKSQPISTLIPQMLISSDNTLGEQLARITSKGAGADGTFASLTGVYTAALKSYGIPTDGMVIVDGAGQSFQNGVKPSYLASLFVKINGGGQSLDIIKNGLPVAGKTGTLASRFAGQAAVARGAVIAKTGWLASSINLSGIIASRDGTPLTFSFNSVADGISTNARAAIDNLTAGAFQCGDNLSNN